MDIYIQIPNIFDEEKNIPTSFKELIRLQRNNHGINIFYSEGNINEFKDTNEESQVYLTGDIKIIRQFLYSARAKKVKVIENLTTYVRWHFNNFEANSCDYVLSQIAEQLYLNQNYEYLLLNLNNTIETCRNKILIFRDRIDKNYPDHFVKLDFVETTTELREAILTFNIKTFSLKDEFKFEKKNAIIVKGATVYLEKEANRYWHLDTFHDYIEYEVYDHDGCHIGTANELGEVNFDEIVPGRTIKL